MIIMPKTSLTFALFEQFAIIGLTFGFINLCPAKTKQITNDGYNFMELGRNLDSKRCINLVLKINSFLTIADNYSELPEELVNECKSIDFSKMDLTNTSIANAYNYQSALYFAEGDYERANEINKNIINTPGMLEVFKNEARCECLFYEITHEQNKEKIDKMYDNKLKKYIKLTEVYPSRLRLLYAYNLLYLKNYKEADKYYKKLQKSITTYVIKADAMQELKVADSLKNFVIK